MRKGTFPELFVFKKKHLFHKLRIYTDVLPGSSCKPNLAKDFKRFWGGAKYNYVDFNFSTSTNIQQMMPC